MRYFSEKFVCKFPYTDKTMRRKKILQKIYFFENLISSHNYHNYDTLLKRERQEKLYYLIDT